MNRSIFCVVLAVTLAHVPSVAGATPYVQSVSPREGPKNGGTKIRIRGTGFKDTPDLMARFTRVNPENEQIVEALTECSYRDDSEIECDSPVYDEAPCKWCEAQGQATCSPSCANTYSWDNREAHANVLNDNGSPHYVATSNHHPNLAAPLGRYPCPTCSNEYDVHNNPNGVKPMGWKNTQSGFAGYRYNNAQAATIFTGHTGSKYLRTNSPFTNTEIGRGQYIKINSQFFTVVGIEPCSGVGCFCDGQWSSNQLVTNHSATDISAYPVGPNPSSLDNNAMYEYDKNPSRFQSNQPSCTAYGSVPADLAALTEPDGSPATFLNSGNWKEGTKIVLDQAVWRKPDTPNVQFYTNDVYVSSKKVCVDCKCAEGCPMTVTVTNDGRTFSGAGTNGKTWHGSASTFTVKYSIPKVKQIQFPSLLGTRDSTRMFVPATGGTRLRLIGEDFQNSNFLRCYFDIPRVFTSAQYIDDKTVECHVPDFVARAQDSHVHTDPEQDNACADAATTRQFAKDIFKPTAIDRLYDTQCTNSMQNGAAVFKTTDDGVTFTEASNSYSHVQVSNTGRLADLSTVVAMREDGAYKHIESEGSLYRSTCYQLPYPTSWDDSAVRPGHEQSYPCHNAHMSGNLYGSGNDVRIKYSPCYQGLSAKTAAGMNYYGSSEASGYRQAINSTQSLGQVFRIPADAEGPISAVKLHLVKPRPAANSAQCSEPVDCQETLRANTVLKACISSGNFYGMTDSMTLSCEEFSIQSIDAASDEYFVYFSKPAYVLGYYDSSSTAGYQSGPSFEAKYYLSVMHVSGPETVLWAMSDQLSGPSLLATAGTSNAFRHHSGASSEVLAGHGFRAAFYTCDGCRWSYRSVQTADDTTYQVGKIEGRQDRSETFLSTHPSYKCRSTSTQVIGRSHMNEQYVTAESLPRVNSAKDPTGLYADECGTPTYREQMAQAIRVNEDLSLAKMRTQLRVAYSPSSDSHEQRTATGDFKAADGSKVSVWITEHGKMGEYVCQTFTGTPQTSSSGWQNQYAAPSGMSANTAAFGHTGGTDQLHGCGTDNKDCMHCDSNNDGVYEELCFVGALCNASMPEVYGGCGIHGKCEMSRVVDNGHVLRNHADGSGPYTSRCGEDEDCDNSQELKVQHSITLPEAANGAAKHYVIWEFATPVILKKHVTYYVNMAIDDSISVSDSVYWLAGTAATTDNDPSDSPGREAFLGSYSRVNKVVNNQTFFTWVKNPTNVKFDLELFRCVSATASIEDISAPGEGSGACVARSAPEGGDAAPTIRVTGRNFFPSSHLGIAFLYPDGSMGPTASCTSTRYDYTEMECQVPAFDPHAGVDCKVPGNCDGVNVVATNDGINYGVEQMNPKYIAPYNDCNAAASPTGGCDATPSYITAPHSTADNFVQLLGKNTKRFCFHNIHVSPHGNDFSGDGSEARPFRTIQRALDAANPTDVVTLAPGTYKGTGNRALRHMNKKVTIQTYEQGSRNGECWCGRYRCTLDNGKKNPLCNGKEMRWMPGNHNSNRDNTVVDCEHSPDGFVIDNNKDSLSPHSGHVDFDAIKIQNCESNIRLY